MQHIRIEPIHYNFFCPVTGARITDSEQFIPSPAHLFCYIDEGVFEHVREDFIPYIEKVGIDASSGVIEADWDTFEAVIQQLNDDGLVLFEITYSGMACGPVSMTAYHCIDMNYVEGEEDID